MLRVYKRRVVKLQHDERKMRATPGAGRKEQVGRGWGSREEEDRERWRRRRQKDRHDKDKARWVYKDGGSPAHGRENEG